MQRCAPAVGTAKSLLALLVACTILFAAAATVVAAADTAEADAAVPAGSDPTQPDSQLNPLASVDSSSSSSSTRTSSIEEPSGGVAIVTTDGTLVDDAQSQETTQTAHAASMADESKTVVDAPAAAAAAAGGSSGGAASGIAAVVVGATGSMGRRMVHLLAKDPRVSKVTAVARSTIADPATLFELTDAAEALAKVRPATVNFDELVANGTGSDVFAGHHVGLSGLGLYTNSARNEAHFRQVEIDYNVAAAKAMIAGGVTRHAYLSGQGAKDGGWMMFARVKADAERTLRQLPGLQTASAARPGYIAHRLGGLMYTGEGMIEKLFGWGVVPGSAEIDVARAMIHSVLGPAQEVMPIMENADIQRIAPRYIASLAALEHK